MARKPRIKPADRPAEPGSTLESIREFQAAAREFYASDPPPGCGFLCPANCSHRSA